jgi:hypothetical protein
MRTKGKLLSVPFLCLYLAAILAIVLNFGRTRWESTSWFPIAVGGTAALAIIPYRYFLRKSLSNRSAGGGRIVLFFFAGLFPLVFIPFLDRNELLLICGLLGASVLFFWAAFGVLFQWPGFRPPPKPNECPRCRYDLTGNTSGVCPECGTPMEIKPGAEADTGTLN